jgi:cyclase
MNTHVRWRGRCLGIGAALWSAGALAQQQDFSKVEIKVVPVSASIYMLQGAGGNIGVSVGDDGIVIVDDQYAPLAEKIRAALKGIADKPVRYVINTHYHFDHTGGNEFMGKEATLVAHDNVRKRLANGSTAGNGGSRKIEMPASPAGALPVVTYEHDVTLHFNGEEIRALHFPSGHTDGDSVVFFPKANVVHMGDDFVTYGFPFIDLNGGGSVAGIIAACESAIAQLPPNVKVIPGHGPLSTLDDMRRFVTMIKETRSAVEKGMKAGKTIEQLQKEKVLEPWKQFEGPFITADLFIETLYNDLSGRKTASLLRH